jgi:hypothetical protein
MRHIEQDLMSRIPNIDPDCSGVSAELHENVHHGLPVRELAVNLTWTTLLPYNFCHF